METLYTGVTQGKLVHQKRFDEILKYFEGKKVKITFDNPKRRSKDQNAYYFGIVLKLLAEHTGYTTDEMHEICKYKFLGIDNKEIEGESIPIINSSRTLSTSDFMGYLEEIKQWAATLNVVIPDPNQEDFLD